MVTRLLPSPDVQTYTTGRRRVVVHRWPARVVTQVESGEVWRAANARLLKLRAERARRQAEAVAEYEDRRERALAAVREAFPMWSDAIPAAAEAMHQLNRLAWNRSTLGRERIYALKNAFIRTLYEANFFSRVEVHSMQLPAKVCYGCEGSGEDDLFGDECRRCDGTGVYMHAATVESLCFYCTIGGIDYSWHQPRSLVTYGVDVNSDSRPMPTLPEHRPHTLETFEIRALAMLVVAFVAKKGDVTTSDYG